MLLYLKQKVFSIGDKFKVYDFNGNEKYMVEGEILTLTKKLHVCTPEGHELAFIEGKLLSFLPRFYISRNGIQIAEMVKKITFLRQEYFIDGFNWTVNGDFLAHEYTISDGTKNIVSVSKRWMTFGDTYEISIADGVDEINALCAVLIIDACIERQNSNYHH